MVAVKAPGEVRGSSVSKRFIQLSEVSEVLDISSAQAYALVRSGELPPLAPLLSEPTLAEVVEP